MPTITLQVGQCGNQLGQALWECLQAQSAAAADPLADVEHFKCTAQGARRARCLLVDTEPKVVNAVLAQDRAGIFSRSRCFLGQSGRGNNWAFGYRQLAPVGGGTRQPASAASGGARWNSSTAAEDPNQQEFHILEQVLDGIRREAEECDGAPSFLLLHSLGGGSGSGTGSRVLEHLREEYPLSYIAAASIAPRETGDTPMQSLNAVLALSFLQAYADVVLLFSNRELLDVAARREQLLGAGGSGGGPGGGSTDLADLNRVIARRLAGCLWPLDAADALGGRGRIRDLVRWGAVGVSQGGNGGEHGVGREWGRRAWLEGRGGEGGSGKERSVVATNSLHQPTCPRRLPLQACHTATPFMRCSAL